MVATQFYKFMLEIVFISIFLYQAIMFAFLKQIIEERRRYLQLEKRPVKTAKSMNVSKKFLEALRLSFEVRYLDENIRLSKKKNKIKAIEDRIDTLYDNVTDVSMDPKFDDIVALGAAYYNVGLVHANSYNIDELNSAVECFSRCLKLLKDKQLDPKAILTTLGALNEINLVCDKVKEKAHSFKFLNTAMELYLSYTLDDDFPDPVHIATIVDIKEKESNPIVLLDTFHYTTLQDIGIQYLAQPKDKHGFVMYMHQILKSRLSEMILGGRQFKKKCFDWAATLFDLSKYFLANNRFFEARHHIAAADYIISRIYEDRFETKEDSESELLHWCESHNYICGISDRSWGTYGVLLLRFWMEKFLQNRGENSLESIFSELGINCEEKSKLLIFPDLEKEFENMTNQITNTCILNLTDAKSVFIQTLRHLDAAKEIFSPDTDIETYTQIILEISDTYKYLAGFEQQRSKQIKLHKRRVECLENVCKKFHTTPNINTELQIYKRVWFEIVTSCSTVMDLLLEETYSNESVKTTVEEVNRFANLISENINLYLNV